MLETLSARLPLDDNDSNVSARLRSVKSLLIDADFRWVIVNLSLLDSIVRIKIA